MFDALRVCKYKSEMLGAHVQMLMNVSLQTVRTMHSALATVMQQPRMLTLMLQVAELTNTK